MYTTPGGNTPQTLVNRTCRDIAAGDVDVVLVGGAEAWRTRTAAKARRRPARRGPSSPRTPSPTRSSAASSTCASMVHPLELARGVVMPVQVYPVFESRPAGRGRRDARRVGRRASAGCGRGFSEVAAANPHAWIQQALTADEMVTPSAATTA